MKNSLSLFTVFVLLYTNSLTAKNYFIAANGNNNNNGLSPATPWQSISKLNASFGIIAAGDSIFFRRGDTFYGVITVGKSGATGRPIVFTAYGSGEKPVITGFVRPTGWTNVSGSIYQAYVPGAKATLNMVTINGLPKALGRYPNADAANGGFLSYESSSGSTSITDNQLTSGTNWTGAEVAIRKTLWVIDRATVTSQYGGTLNFKDKYNSTYKGTPNYGYFFQNDARTLDEAGEWFLNKTTKYLRMHFGGGSPSNFAVKVSTLDTLFKSINKSNITVNNLKFDGANGVALYAEMGSNVNVQGCDFTNSGVGAIHYKAMSNVLIDNCTTYNMLSNGIMIEAIRSSGITIRNCALTNTGVIAGMGGGNGNSYKAIYVNALSNVLIEYNRIDSTGYIGIEFQGSNATVRNNVVNHFNFVKDDGGGIYTYAAGNDANPGPNYTNRTISNNIIMNGIGAPNGRSSNSLYTSGIYLDGRTMNVNVLNNSMFNIGKNGIHANNPINITVRGNTCYNALNNMSVARWSGSTISNLVVKRNIFFPTLSTQRAFYYTNTGINDPVATTLQSAIRRLGTIDSNVYSNANATGFNFEIYSTSGGAGIPTSPLSLEGWKAMSGFDANGRYAAKMPISYKLNRLISTNKVSNGSFNTAISGFTAFGSSITSAFDNTGKISGGALRVSFGNPAPNKYALYHSPVGAISSAKQYIMRVSTYGTTVKGIIRAYLRRTTSPYENLVPLQSRTFGLGITNHEFLFTAPASVSAGSIVIEIEQTSGTTYIDNVALYEADATVYNPADQLKFVYNDTRAAKTISLGANYFGVTGLVYSGSITLQPFTSAILVKDMGLVSARTDSTDSVTVIDSVVVTDSLALADSTSKINTSNNRLRTEVQKSNSTTQPLALIVYPNPSAGAFNLVLQGGSEEKIAIQVFSVDGRLQYQTNATSNSRTSFGDRLQAGTYIVRVMQGTQLQTLKLIKTN